MELTLKRYIYKINLIVEGSPDDLVKQARIDDSIETLIRNDDSINVVSTEIVDLSLNLNCGKCRNCQTWVTDKRYDNSVSELSNGAIVNGEWLCDLCLPKQHPNSF